MLALACATSALACGFALADGSSPTVRSGRGCYLVGQSVRIAGAGFAADREFDVAIDGVDFGQGITDASGAFASSVITGSLGAGVAQQVDSLDATDGTVSADTVFTVTRAAGARFLASRGNPSTLRAPFQVWGFSLSGIPRPVYVHYVSPSGRLRTSSALGRTGGQCGYLLTGSRRVFPFRPSSGSWTLQVDTRRTYSRTPGGPVARIRVLISG